MTDEKNGLTQREVEARRREFGKNELFCEKKQSFFIKAVKIFLEPMFVLLIVAAIIYFILGEPRDGAIMLVFVFGIIFIDIIQEWKTDRTLNALKDLSSPHITVIRDGEEKLVLSGELVPDDVMKLSEGIKVPADGYVLKCNDLCVNESSLTGEAEGVWKTERGKTEETADYFKKDYVYAGTYVTQGSGYVLVDKIGSGTEYGKIGKGISEAKEKPTPLQKQTGRLVKTCVGLAAVLFALVGLVTYFNLDGLAVKDRVIASILSGITLAMAMIPEEFPVILTIFLSMGAWRLAKKKSLVRKLPSVETLGAVTVLCVDKTGTITMNQMTVTETEAFNSSTERLIKTMAMACEREAYDSMEKAMLGFCAETGLDITALNNYPLAFEYSFTNELKMMGHVYGDENGFRLCVKGSGESVLNICSLSEDELKLAREKIDSMSARGLRVIAVGEQLFEAKDEIPASILQCRLTLLGFIGLIDPPRKSVAKDIAECVKANIRVVMITGDNGITASSIAKQIGMPNAENIITGEQINNMTDAELCECVKSVSIFSRVVPEHKMRIVKAFRQNGDVVAMTGDGVNDAPALKHADIGIAMGMRGSEVAREAADLILMDDNFSTIVDTIKDGRRIYKNIKRAVGYVFTIHIPIALAALLAPLLKIAPQYIMLLPLHVMLLELIIDPTCSIVLERIPAEGNIMEEKPRNPKENILKSGTLIKSILQGLILFAASFIPYVLLDPSGGEESAERARSVAITVLILANLFLVVVNSSDSEFAVMTLRKLIKDKVMWLVALLTLVMLLIILYTPLNGLLKLAPLSAADFFMSFGLAFASVIWYEAVKLVKFITKKRKSD